MNEDKFMMSHPTFWPCRPVLPVKRYSKKPGAFPDCGLLWENGKYPNTVFLTNMYDIKSTKDLESVKKEEYDSLDALLAAGWIVD